MWNNPDVKISTILYIIIQICFYKVNLTNGQENAQLQVPPSLVECYMNDDFFNRDNRLPHNIETLITLIQKIENTPYFDQDIRQLTISLLHRFRQDGIQRAPGVVASPGVLPYSPIGFQFPKFRILLSRLIPGNALRFPNDTLTREERCSLHFMLSNSLETRVRGDEHQVCNKLAEYRAKRLPRQLHHHHHHHPSSHSLKKHHNLRHMKMTSFRRPRHIKHHHSNFIGDVEILQQLPFNRKQRVLQPRANGNMEDVDFGWAEIEPGFPGEHSISQCPVENGVIYTPWGTVSAGTLIAGIAAGLQPQTVQLKTLLALASRRSSVARNLPQMATVNIDNRWAATLAGDLAEIALIQAPGTMRTAVGASGAWNSTVMPKWYFLSQRHNLELTDAEIRGGLDGLIIAMNIANWRTQASNLKLSQLLRMYYSPDGVLGTDIKACNRKDNFANYAPLNAMIAQTSAFAQVLDREIQLRVTLTPEAIANFSTEAANTLYNYIPQYLNDVPCKANGVWPQDVSDSITPMTNLYVYLDTSWPYNEVVEYLNYIFKNLNINPYASSVTLLTSADGSIIVNTTNYLSDVFTNWNISSHKSFIPGFNLPVVLRSVKELTKMLMDEEKRNSSAGGLSLVALIVPYMTQIGESDANYAAEQLSYMSEEIPDLHFIYYASGMVDRFRRFVKDPSQDLFPLSSDSNIPNSADPVINRIKKIPRRLINHRCGSKWSNQDRGSDKLTQFVQPGGINFYRLSSNYFYRKGGDRYVKVQSQNYASFTVCTSRFIERPQQNSTSFNRDQQTCRSIQSNTYSYDISNACEDYSTIHQCPPLYISVQAPESTAGNGNTPIVSCTEAACLTPDHLRYAIELINLGCYSGVNKFTANFIVLALIYFFRQFLQ